MTETILEALRVERAKAAAIVDACDVALKAFGAVVLSVAPASAPKPVKAKRTTAAAPRAKAIKVDTSAGGDSKVSRYADAVVKILSHHTREPHYSADSTVIRREIAKACGVDAAKDASFAGDVSNALQKLKTQGKVERSGSVWALTAAARMAA